jgi:hypothetical protein
MRESLIALRLLAILARRVASYDDDARDVGVYAVRIVLPFDAG